MATYYPRIDKEASRPFLPESPLEMLRSGSADVARVPWMTGVTNQEGAWQACTMYGSDDFEMLRLWDSDPDVMETLFYGFKEV